MSASVSPLPALISRSGSSPRRDEAVTEDAAASIFADRYGQTFKFNGTEGKWLRFTGSHWEPDRRKTCPEAIRVTLREVAPERLHNSKSMKGVEQICKSAPQFASVSEDFNSDPLQLATPDGTIDLQTGRLRVARREDLNSHCTSVGPKDSKPAHWLRFLEEATGGDREYQRFIQQCLGYSCTGLTHEHALFFLHGEGGTGKSTLVNTAAQVLGSYAMTAPMDTFTASKIDRHSAEIAMMHSARMVTANETEQGRTWAAARIKSLTGGDPITARFMRQDFFSYLPKFKLFFVGNFAPSFETVDEAMRRRFYVLPFDVKPQKKDPHLTQKLAAEAGGILSWFIEGCCDWLENGLVVPAKVNAATATYFEEQDLFARWLDERVSRCEPKISTPKSRVLASWNAYRVAAGERAESARDLSQRLRRRGFHEGRSSDHANRERVWFGMEITGDA